MGDYDSAIVWQTKAIDAAPETARESLRKQLKRYESRQPLREEP